MDGAYLVVGTLPFTGSTSARFPFSTRGVQELAIPQGLKGTWYQDLRLFPGIVLSLADRQSMTEGKMHIGGIGVSGDTSDEDERALRLDLMPSRVLSNRSRAFAIRIPRCIMRGNKLASVVERDLCNKAAARDRPK